MEYSSYHAASSVSRTTPVRARHADRQGISHLDLLPQDKSLQFDRSTAIVGLLQRMGSRFLNCDLRFEIVPYLTAAHSQPRTVHCPLTTDHCLLALRRGQLPNPSRYVAAL